MFSDDTHDISNFIQLYDKSKDIDLFENLSCYFFLKKRRRYRTHGQNNIITSTNYFKRKDDYRNTMSYHLHKVGRRKNNKSKASTVKR